MQAIRIKALNIIAPSMIKVPSNMLNISAREISCQIDNPHRQRAAMVIPASMAAVFLRTFSSEKIKIGLADYGSCE